MSQVSQREVQEVARLFSVLPKSTKEYVTGWIDGYVHRRMDEQENGNQGQGEDKKAAV